MYGGKLLFLSSYQNQVSGKRLYALCFQCCLSLSMSSLSPLSDAAKLSKGSFQARWCFTVGGGRAETPRRLPPAQFSLARWYLSPGGSDGKASTCNVGDLGSIPGLGRSSGEGNGNPLQYSYLENLMDGAWQAIVHGVTMSQTRLSDFTSPFLAGVALHTCSPVSLSVGVRGPSKAQD